MRSNQEHIRCGRGRGEFEPWPIRELVEISLAAAVPLIQRSHRNMLRSKEKRTRFISMERRRIGSCSVLGITPEGAGEGVSSLFSAVTAGVCRLA